MGNSKAQEGKPQSIEDILELFEQHIHNRTRVHKFPELSKEAALQALYEAVRDFVETNQKGTFEDDGGNICWYLDDLVVALGALFGVEDDGNLDEPEATNSQPQLADNRCGICGDGGHTAFACPNTGISKEGEDNDKV